MECQVCKDNTVSKAGASICTECTEGTEANANKTQCGKFIIFSSHFLFLQYHQYKFETNLTKATPIEGSFCL